MQYIFLSSFPFHIFLHFFNYMFTPSLPFFYSPSSPIILSSSLPLPLVSSSSWFLTILVDLFSVSQSGSVSLSPSSRQSLFSFAVPPSIMHQVSSHKHYLFYFSSYFLPRLKIFSVFFM